jgi:hypothetical protein
MALEEYTTRVEVKDSQGRPAPFKLIRVETPSGPLADVTYQSGKSDPYLLQYKLKRPLDAITLVLVDSTGEQKVNIKPGINRYTFTSTLAARDETKFPDWAPIAGAIFGIIVLAFFMGIVLLTMSGHPLPSTARFPIISVLALGVALAAAFLGGDATAKGNIPIPFAKDNPVAFAVGGGIAAFVIVFLIASYEFPSESFSAVSPSHTVATASPAPTSSAVSLSFDSGWILLGYYDLTGKHYINVGPFFAVVASTYTEKEDIPRKGDQIRLEKSLHVYIMDYHTYGLLHQSEAMWKVPGGKLRPEDYTGVELPKGTKLEIRDISLGQFPEEPAAVWARVGIVP